jgi:hypothetical protein
MNLQVQLMASMFIQPGRIVADAMMCIFRIDLSDVIRRFSISRTFKYNKWVWLDHDSLNEKSIKRMQRIDRMDVPRSKYLLENNG